MGTTLIYASPAPADAGEQVVSGWTGLGMGDTTQDADGSVRGQGGAEGVRFGLVLSEPAAAQDGSGRGGSLGV